VTLQSLPKAQPGRFARPGWASKGERSRFVDITVYLPDKLGQQAKAAEVNFSGLLRAAVTAELERRAAVSKTLEGAEEHLFTLEDEEGRAYEARLVGREIAHDDGDTIAVYLTEDERVILVDLDNGKYFRLENPEDELREELPPGIYAEAMHALGLKPVVDI
jgi:post-segregation antitoxin (ccd killing protein)